MHPIRALVTWVGTSIYLKRLAKHLALIHSLISASLYWLWNAEINLINVLSL